MKGNTIDIANCGGGGAGQSFTFGDAAGGQVNTPGGKSSTTCTKSTRTVTAAPSPSDDGTAAQTTSAAEAETTGTAGSGSGNGNGNNNNGNQNNTNIPTANPTDPVPVSRAGGTLQPTAAAESHQRDETAKRAFSSVSIRAPNGQCLFIDPTAGDFRENLIPVSLVDCTGLPNEKWDVITEGKHNAPDPRKAAALVVSALVGVFNPMDRREWWLLTLLRLLTDPRLYQLRWKTATGRYGHSVFMRRPC